MKAHTQDTAGEPAELRDLPVSPVAIRSLADAQAPGRSPAQHAERCAHDLGQTPAAAVDGAFPVPSTTGPPGLLRCLRGSAGDRRGGGRRRDRRPSSVARLLKTRMQPSPAHGPGVPDDRDTRIDRKRYCLGQVRRRQRTDGPGDAVHDEGRRLFPRESPLPDLRTRPGEGLAGACRGVAGCT